MAPTCRSVWSSSFEEAAFGTAKSIVVNRTELCGTCNGLRAEPGTEPKRCTACEGSGEVRRVQRSVFGQFINVGVCDRCRGEGLIVETPCKHCRGTGRERVTRTIEVKVPGGVDNGSQVRLTGEGELGSYGGPRGSTYVVLNVANHKVFERYEDDLHVQLNLSFAQAALGDEVEVPVLEPPAEGDTKAARDTTHTLQIKPGTESGEVITIKSKGVPHLRANGRGDLHVHVQVKTPKKLSRSRRTCWSASPRPWTKSLTAKACSKKSKTRWASVRPIDAVVRYSLAAASSNMIESSSSLCSLITGPRCSADSFWSASSRISARNPSQRLDHSSRSSSASSRVLLRLMRAVSTMSNTRTLMPSGPPSSSASNAAWSIDA